MQITSFTSIFLFCSLILLFFLYVLRQKRTLTSSVKIKTPENPHTTRFVPLGDSFTIGEFVKEQESWPSQLISKLRQAGFDITIVAHPARSGFTSQGLIDQELTIFDEAAPDLVSVMIGANDVMQGVDRETFQKNISFILDHIIKTIETQRVILCTIPDYTATSAGKLLPNRISVSQTIQLFNTIISQQATLKGVTLFDSSDLLEKIGTDPRFMTADQLHPNEKGYSHWVKKLLPVFKTVLNETSRGNQ